MNKKAFAILPREIIGIAITALLGLGLWFIYAGIRDYVLETTQMSLLGTIWTGIFIIFVVLFLVKYKPQRLMFG